MDWNEISTLLTARRAELKLTQQTVANRIGVTKAQLQHWEVRRKFPLFGNLKAWAQVLGYEINFELDPGFVLEAEKLPKRRDPLRGHLSKDLRTKLISRRISFGWSQAKLARELGVSGQMVHYFEWGKQKPSKLRLKAWGEALGVEIGFDLWPDAAQSRGAVGDCAAPKIAVLAR